MQQQNLADAIKEAHKPLARHIDDEDLDRMLREQEREGDPMAALLRKKKAKESKLKGIKGPLDLITSDLSVNSEKVYLEADLPCTCK